MRLDFWVAAGLLQLASPIWAAGAEAGSNLAGQPVPAVDPIGLVMVLLGLGGALAVRVALLERRSEKGRPGGAPVVRVRARRFSQP